MKRFQLKKVLSFFIFRGEVPIKQARSMLRKLTLTFFLFLLFSWQVFAGIENVISEEDFRKLAAEIAPKVDLFRDAWTQNPNAVFYGGTTRDYLYWLKGQFKNAANPIEAAQIIGQLRSKPSISVRNFIVGTSDVDIVSTRDLSLDPVQYGVRKIDKISNDIFTRGTEMWHNELNQGHIPAEKIRLGRGGLSQDAQLGDGLHEIFTGKLSVHYAPPEDFAKTKFAREGANHPILLALRYLRLQSINYYQTYGKGYPNQVKLLAGLDPESKKQTAAIIANALKKKELAPFLENARFLSWLNATIDKAFSSYTNPTAALQYMRMFKVDELPVAYKGKIGLPLNQFVFAQDRDPAKIAQAMASWEVDPAKLYEPMKRHFSDGFLYHGTANDDAFLAILLQGPLPSSEGWAGAGLYGVDSNRIHLIGRHVKKDPNLILRFPVKADAKIVDITHGVGKAAFEKYREFSPNEKVVHQEFARAFGIDILKYSWIDNAPAYVVKNSDVLEAPEGVFRSKEQALKRSVCIAVFNRTARPIVGPIVNIFNGLHPIVKVLIGIEVGNGALNTFASLPAKLLLSAADKARIQETEDLLNAPSRTVEQENTILKALGDSNSVLRIKSDLRTKVFAAAEKFNLSDAHLDTLLDLLKSNDSETIASAVRLLGRIKNPKAIEGVISAFGSNSEDVSKAAFEVLKDQQIPPDLIPLLEKNLNRNSTTAQERTIGLLSKKSAGTEANKFLIRSLTANTYSVADKAFAALKDRPLPEDDLPDLTKVLADTGHTNARKMAAELVHKIPGVKATNLLAEHLNDSDWDTFSKINSQLSKRELSPELIPVFLADLKMKNESLNEAAADFLGAIPGDKATQAMAENLDHPQYNVLVKLKSELQNRELSAAIIPILQGHLNKNNNSLTEAAATLLCLIPGEKATQTLAKNLSHQDYETFEIVRKQLSKRTLSADLVPIFQAYLNKNSSTHLTQAAVTFIAAIPDSQATFALAANLSHSSYDVYKAAEKELKKRTLTEEMVPTLVQNYRNSSYEVRGSVVYFLGKIAGEKSISALKALLASESDSEIKKKISATLANLQK